MIQNNNTGGRVQDGTCELKLMFSCSRESSGVASVLHCTALLKATAVLFRERLSGSPLQPSFGVLVKLGRIDLWTGMLLPSLVNLLL